MFPCSIVEGAEVVGCPPLVPPGGDSGVGFVCYSTADEGTLIVGQWPCAKQGACGCEAIYVDVAELYGQHILYGDAVLVAGRREIHFLVLTDGTDECSRPYLRLQFGGVVVELIQSVRFPCQSLANSECTDFVLHYILGLSQLHESRSTALMHYESTHLLLILLLILHELYGATVLWQFLLYLLPRVSQ